jgi:hypothetical protein
MSKRRATTASANKDPRWRDLVHLEPRYRRSVHLERDFLSADALAGYVITPLVRSTLKRVSEGLINGRGRAWSFTGPYGSGKSAFAVFLANVFHHSDARGGSARRMLQAVDSELYRELFRGHAVPYLVPVLATGERKSLEAIVLRALVEAVAEFWSRNQPPKFETHLRKAAAAAERGNRVSAKEVVRFVEEFGNRVGSSKRGRGVLLLIDEAGKALEYAADHPDRGDVQLLQELAEAATRSGDKPLVLGVFLHQAFDQYASRLGNSQRNEWAKVQGRFDDVPFQEAADQVLRLVSMALALKDPPADVKRAAAALIDDVLSVASPPGIPDKVKLRRLLELTIPLHPITALLLGPLFRSQAAQNERSLFAFLSSSEPGGFQAFLETAVESQSGLETFRPDDLFAYLKQALGERLYRQGRQWAQIDSAISRLPKDAGDLEARIVRTVGLLGLVGDSSGVAPSERVIQSAVSDNSAAERARVKRTLEELQTASILVYRRFRNAYQIWDGSDLDITQRVRQAIGQIDPRASLVTLLGRAAPPRPIVARRHLFETGTLRRFNVCYGDERVLDGEWTREDTDSDGVLWIIVPSSDTAAAQLKARLKDEDAGGGSSAIAKPVVVGVMNEVGRLRETVVELSALEWVQAHTPELGSDPVARKELEGRILDAENALRNEMAGLVSGERRASWYYRGNTLPVRNGRELGSQLSEICDRAYSKGPRLLNELLNRSQPSSAAAAARRELLIAMTTHRDKRHLGFEGFPPELSMYRSVLEEHGLHGEIDGKWQFTEPKTGARSLAPTLRALEKLLGKDGTRVPVRGVYDLLTGPPFGIKEGVIPVLLVWELLRREAEVALYEEGSFVPALDGPVIERLIRAPDHFELQRFKIEGARQEFFEEFTGREDSSDLGPLPLVRQFVKLVQELPAFTRNTRELSTSAVTVRDALLKAKEPGTLMFRDLPQACGFDPLPTVRDAALPTRFVGALNAAIRELRSAYPRLLDRIRNHIGRVFVLPSDTGEMRHELSMRAKRLLSVAADQQLKTFLVRASDESIDADAWTVSIGTFLGGRPPESWVDADLQRLSVNLAMTARKFAALEAAFLEHQQAGLPEGAMAVRVSITEAGQQEAERVVLVRREERHQLEAVVERLREAVEAERGDASRESLVASLAQVMRQLISDMEPESDVTEGVEK